MSKISREDIIVLILFAVVGIIIAAAIAANHFYMIDPIAWLHFEWGRTFLGYIALILATLVCLFNFYVSIFVPWQYERQHGSMKDFAHMSGLPMLGSIFVFCAGILLPPSFYLGVFLLVIYVLDGNGLPNFFVSVLREGV